MITILLVARPSATTTALRAELQATGVQIAGVCERASLVADAIRLAPDVLVCHDTMLDDPLLAALDTLQQHAPLPVVLATTDTDAERLDRALAAGVQEVVFGVPEAARLRPLLQLARARFRRQRALVEQLGDVTQRFEERKTVDRAKGVLMAVRRLSEDEAYTLMRTLAMQGGMRLGDLARQVIDGARAAADVNRSGLLRMLSQRIVKLQALATGRPPVAEARELLAQSVARVEAIVEALRSELSAATFGDLLESLLKAWTGVQSALARAPSATALKALDSAAEALLAQSETLTGALEHAGSAATLRVVNVAGRQRMLSQRVAKLALLGGTPEALAQACAEFESGLATLRASPLSTAEIRQGLAAAEAQWRALQGGVAAEAEPEGRRTLAAASEALLAELDALTGLYERSMQVLLG